MKERLCFEVERLGLSVLIVGSRGFGALRRGNKGRLVSVSDYCVHYCVCPVAVVVRFPQRDKIQPTWVMIETRGNKRIRTWGIVEKQRYDMDENKSPQKPNTMQKIG